MQVRPRGQARIGLGFALGSRGLFKEAVSENRRALAELELLLAKNPGLGRIRNLQAIWLAAQGELRFKQATAAQSKQAWKEAEESLQRAMDAFNLLEKDAALTGASTRS